MTGVFLGTLSLTTIYSKILEYAGPRLMSTLGLDINFLVTLTVLCFAIFTSAIYFRDGVKSLLYDYYSCTVKVVSQDPLFSALMTFLEEEGAFNMSKVESQQSQIGEQDTEVKEKGWGQKMKAGLKQSNKIKYAPAPSCEDFFYYKPTGTTITIIREEIPNSQSSWWNPRPKQQVQLTVYGKDPTPLKMLFEEVVERQNNKDHGRTAVYKARQGSEGGATGAEWIRCFTKPVRSLDTVILDEKQKEEISEDLKEFLLPATNKWYSNRGLPYRRGYLLYGPPGTGKTSLSVALAGKFGLSVYALSLSVAWMNDDTLALLFSSLPKNCIVLLEDIDACGNNNSNTKAGVQVSFSGLLNAIDGVASKEGRALIMTTNHRERLDEALIRPGRVDLQIKFAHADKKIIHGLFRAIYEVNESDKRILKFPNDFPDDDEIADLANVFAEKVPEHIFSPAEVQGFLLRHKKNPRRAAAEVVAWAEQELLEKKERERKEKEKEEKEQEEKERGERKERRKRAKEEREKRAKREKRRKEGKASSDDTDTEDEKEEAKKEDDKRVVYSLINEDSANIVVNGINEKMVGGVAKDVVKVNGSA
ncbi:P-loop containing nucleoside triphosphate hydrolase protein [Terfezia boudieri ATCC MYA-4762]|uniref:P-loop containing nucleoside triphosphate hydrolase protein n=1 Tax=Terfezia boudieri ATCC MYA-4762 TaxID=1051890 RepID=A0A3N4M7W7_9PEZI|nr:P-loop containing nucleoside triphosphate hydrolase protein [Terfezia boudieri ATCC MYA-4762]